EYTTLLRRVTSVSPFVVCLGIWQPTNAPNGIGVLAEAYDQVIWNLCPRYGDLQALFANSAYHGPVGLSTWMGPADYFHPNDAGHAAIATEVESVARTRFPAERRPARIAQLHRRSADPLSGKPALRTGLRRPPPTGRSVLGRPYPLRDQVRQPPPEQLLQLSDDSQHRGRVRNCA
ncbi:MAG TPA: SGNH/GDSL hydrolase family protein, partial [Ktedonobacterales bacterium]